MNGKTKLRKYIRKVLSESFENLSYGYFKDKTAIPDFDALKKGLYDELPKVYQKQEAFVDFMTKDAYIHECAVMQRTSDAQQLTFIDKNKVQEYMSAMESGAKFNMGYLNYFTGQQEGRHRVVAAAELGQIKIPVLIIEKKQTSYGTLALKIGEWEDLKQDENGNFIITYNLFAPPSYEDDRKLLSVFADGYDEYLLDDILSDKIYSKYKKEYNKSHMNMIGHKIRLRYYDIDHLFPEEFLSEIKFEMDGDYKEYMPTPEQITYMKFIIALSLDDEVKRVNKDILHYINLSGKTATIIIDKNMTFENLEEFNNAKDFLISEKPFDLSLKTPNEVDIKKIDIANNMAKYPFNQSI